MNASIETLDIKGEPKRYTVKRGETLKVEEGFPKNCAIVLVFINGTSDGYDIGMEKGGRLFVPTFEVGKAPHEMILAWSSIMITEPPVENIAPTKIKGKVDLKENTITITGENFEDATIEVVEFEAPAEKPAEETETVIQTKPTPEGFPAPKTLAELTAE